MKFDHKLHELFTHSMQMIHFGMVRVVELPPGEVCLVCPFVNNSELYI